MYNNNLHLILYMMAARELDVNYRANHLGYFPMNECCLRWTIEEEARKMIPTFGNLSNVCFNRTENGVIRLYTINRIKQACNHAEDFYMIYHEQDKWRKDVYELFNQLVYLRTVKLAEVATGIRMDLKWINNTMRNYVEHPHAFSFNQEPKMLRDRISRGEFDPFEREVCKLSEFLPDLEKSLDNTLINTYGFVYSTAKFLWMDDPVVDNRCYHD